VYSKEYTIEFNNKIDLKNTLESGQTFLWNRSDNDMYSPTKEPIYTTCRNYNEEIVGLQVQQSGDNSLKIRSNSELGKEITENIFGKNKYNLQNIQKEIIKRDSKDGVMKDAVTKYDGLRIIHEPLFPTLISFICSTQMRVERIHQMINNLKSNYGSELETSDRIQYAFPKPSQLSKATIEDLRDLKLGYRSEYVVKTTTMFHSKDFTLPNDINEARKSIKDFMGVGTKVADCVLLYSGGFWSVVPVDTWIESAVEKYYPELYANSNEQIARNFQDFFGRFAGFAQAYLFHYMRKN
jgi:N-glycosylase/DNA lyase